MTSPAPFGIPNYSDMHKDAYGFRPVGPAPVFASAAEARAEAHRLQGIIEREIELERAREQHMQEKFEERITGMMTSLGQNRATVIRWEMQAEGLDYAEYQDREHYYYEQGLAWSVIEALLQA